MADKTTFILIAGGIGLAWYEGWLAPLGIPGPSSAAAATAAPAATATPTTPAATTPAPTAPTPAPPASTTPPANTLDGIYAKLVSAAGDPSGGLGVDAWGYYLNQILSGAGLGPAPDPVPVFSLGSDRSQLFTASDYWAKMAPALKTQYGLSGLGPRGLGWMAGWR